MRLMKRIGLSASICATLLALALVASDIPFWVYPDWEYGEAAAGLFSAEYWLRLAPLALILMITAAGIAAIRCLRQKKSRGFRSALRNRDGKREKAVPGQKRFGFMALRWTIMMVSPLVMLFGGSLLGLRFASISLPIFFCDFNTTQLTTTSCYYLSHLTELTQLPLSEILIFLATTVGVTLLLGRAICGFLCPMGLVQDLVHALRQRLRGEGVTLTERHYTALSLVRWTMVLAMLGLCFVGADFCAFCPAAALTPAVAGVRVSLYFSGLFMILVLIGGFFKRRLFCNICPLGVLLGLSCNISPFRIKKDCQSCTECGICYEACPMGVKAIYTEREKEDVTDQNCIFCGACIRKCPENNALSMTFCGHPIYTASRANALSGYESMAREADGELDS